MKESSVGLLGTLIERWRGEAKQQDLRRQERGALAPLENDYRVCAMVLRQVADELEAALATLPQQYRVLSADDLQLVASVFTDCATEKDVAADPDVQAEAPRFREISRKADKQAFDLKRGALHPAPPQEHDWPLYELRVERRHFTLPKEGDYTASGPVLRLCQAIDAVLADDAVDPPMMDQPQSDPQGQEPRLRPLTTREQNNLGRFNPLRGTDAELPALPPAHGWQPIETAPERKKVLVSWINALGKRRTAMASYWPVGQLEMAEDVPDYQVTESGTNLDAGWWEESEGNDDAMFRLVETMTHWMPLPAPPLADKE